MRDNDQQCKGIMNNLHAYNFAPFVAFILLISKLHEMGGEDPSDVRVYDYVKTEHI